MALCPQGVSQAPQHFRSSETQATCDQWLLCPPVCLLGHFRSLRHVRGSTAHPHLDRAIRGEKEQITAKVRPGNTQNTLTQSHKSMLKRPIATHNSPGAWPPRSGASASIMATALLDLKVGGDPGPRELAPLRRHASRSGFPWAAMAGYYFNVYLKRRSPGEGRVNQVRFPCRTAFGQSSA